MRMRSSGGWLAAVVVAAGVGLVCGRWAFAPPSVEQPTAAKPTATVQELTVGTSVPLAVSASWSAAPFGVGAAEGTLTSLAVADGDTVTAGQVLYTVDLRPVVAAVGAVPAFRDLSRGATGADVVQLQQLLIDTGHLSGPANGVFGASTARAVREWQRSLGVTRDGVVRAGDLVFAQGLPARVRLADEVTVGDRLAAGDVVLSVLTGTPKFVATVQMLSGGPGTDSSLPIEVVFDDEPVTAVVTGVREADGGITIWELAREDGSPLCADRCDRVPLDSSEAVFPARQVVIPSVTGPGVPAAAVWFTADGDPYVVTPDGVQVPVEITGQGQGSVVLSGIDVGAVVVLPDDAGAASARTPTSNTPAPATSDETTPTAPASDDS